MPKFSVIIPIYNAEKYLDQCLESLLGQQYEDFELLLVNDCSTDGSIDICQKYAVQNKNVRLINQEINRGVSAARNLGIEGASGKYILFVDSDDYVEEEYFDTLDNLTKQFDGNELLSFGHYDYLIEKNGANTTKRSGMNCNLNSIEPDSWVKLFLQSFFASPWNKVFQRSILVKYGIRFDTDCVCYEDYLFNVSYCKHIERFKVVDRPLYFYRQIMSVNHVGKRKWGKRFEISEKVARATNEFIASKGAENTLSAIRRYTYKAFLVELEASYQVGDTFEDDVSELIHNEAFNESVNAIVPSGKMLFLYKAVRLFHVDFMSKKLLMKLIG